MDASAQEHGIEKLKEFRSGLEGSTESDLSTLQAELDSMIAESKKPGYSGDTAEVLQRKRALVINAMETARRILANEAVDALAANVEPDAVESSEKERTSEATTSAFVSATEKSEPAKTPVPVTGTRFERFMSGARSMASSGYDNVRTFLSWAGQGVSDLLAYAGTSIAALWNRWFGKKETTTQAPSTATSTPSEPVANPEAQARYDEDPPSASPVAPSPSDATTEAPNTTRRDEENPPRSEASTTDAIPSGAEGGIVTTDTEPTVSSAAPLTEAEATPAPEPAEVSIMDNKEHEIAGHRFLWNGSAEHFISFDGKKFGISAVSQLIVSQGLRSISTKGDALIIETISGKLELDSEQLKSLVKQIADGKTEIKTGLFGGRKTIMPVTIQYTSEISTGARTRKSTVIELLPQ